MANYDPNANYETAAFVLADGSEHTVYAVPPAFLAAMVTQIRSADDGGTARTITLIARISGVDYTLVFTGAIVANEPRIDNFDLLTLKTGDSIKATASAGGVHVLVSFAQQSRRT